jgi:CAAX prenyl protease-like protein
MQQGVRLRLFLILFFLGVVGILSFLLVDLAALVALFPVPPGSQAPVITPVIKILSLLQPAVLLLIAVFVGVLLARRVGLSSPFVESLAAGQATPAFLRPQVMPGILGGVIGGTLILLMAAAFRTLLTPETSARITKFGTLVPLPTRVLYGGITEELLLRWGFMTFIVWAAWRLFQRRRSEPTRMPFVVAILVSSFVFGVGHLPIAMLLLGELTVAMILYVIFANSAFGIVAGYLYWKYGLESAIFAHMVNHVVLATASYAGAYF